MSVFSSRAVGTFARALDCSSSVRQPSLHMSAAAASRDITLVSQAWTCCKKRPLDCHYCGAIFFPSGVFRYCSQTLVWPGQNLKSWMFNLSKTRAGKSPEQSFMFLARHHSNQFLGCGCNSTGLRLKSPPAPPSPLHDTVPCHGHTAPPQLRPVQRPQRAGARRRPRPLQGRDGGVERLGGGHV